METFTVVMAMLVAVLLSGVLVRLLPLAVPLPFVQIGLGFVVAAVFQRGVLIEPDIFFLLFLPPLLFLDGWRVSKLAVMRESSSILQLAFGLVFVTVIGVGYLIHWMIPAVPLAVAFAIAAIVSPTDPVAVEAISRKVAVPRRMMAILEGEALFNDASGLVAFRFAVVAAATGTFSLTQAALSFVWVSAAGIAIGAGLTLLAMRARRLVSRRLGEEPGVDVLLSLVTPFFVYYVAEQAGASGILAAVAAGIAMSYAEMSGGALAATRMERHAVWNMVQFTLNGMMFVLLGEQFPTILANLSRAAQESGGHSIYWLPLYGLAISLGLVLCRLLWVVVALKVNAAAARRRGGEPVRIGLRVILAMSLAGVRGAVTLAGVMTLPFALDNGAPFPARDLAISLAAMVIVYSLLLASASLPRLLRGLHFPPNGRVRRELALAQEAMLQAALDGVAQYARRRIAAHPEDTGLYADAADSLAADLRRQAGEVPDGTSAEDLEKQAGIERLMRLEAIAASRQALFRLARTHRISDTLAREQVRLLDLHEARLR
ncbi:Sodium, potassium, lithium and rubidium/H(+) antiporter [Achromobacter veterisilvae]|uniref:Sodium, potassium, lithium and rubidium/H(+) antiporter n=1 Tax=Achromobacter veterisilvae TaxID=2069367 RepID=A0A446CUZ4_9BURK|nr:MULTISPECIES: Na+/H+ antiporter [Achromobacter]MCW0205468.1 Na+/H+ antiporter [Achromobacter sp.]SSW71671.1 Sodium, potassium, lithium and rubidium/H(+) antiporter [Achromobacter veterisilvae]